MAQISEVLRKVRKESPILYYIAIINLIGALICIPGLLWDDRTLMGVNVWIKPIKFLISVGIYILTLGYLITFYPFSSLKKKIIRNIVAWTLLFENIIIVTQGVRGVQSHYNVHTVLDSILFGMMGFLIAINVVVMAFFVIETIRLKLTVSRPMQWAILSAWIITVFGSWIGGQMIGQMAHNVGIADGGPGLPLVKWSSVAGDLRVAHFFGLHAIQLIPLFALLIQKNAKWSDSSKTMIVLGFASIYLIFTAGVFYQAIMGKPFIGF
ncbi:hypothetical protein LVD13_04330 [Flavobacteriaceae bacterium D16]|nr:hypothetical protein [Flavobacteriaceae bacterium D16]